MIEVKVSVFGYEDRNQLWWYNFMASLQSSDWISLGRTIREIRVDTELKKYHGRLISWVDSEFNRTIGFESEAHMNWFILRWS